MGVGAIHPALTRAPAPHRGSVAGAARRFRTVIRSGIP
jgi:hypothetical protein